MQKTTQEVMEEEKTSIVDLKLTIYALCDAIKDKSLDMLENGEAYTDPLDHIAIAIKYLHQDFDNVQN